MTAKSVSTDESYVGRDIIKEDNYALGLSRLLGDHTIGTIFQLK